MSYSTIDRRQFLQTTASLTIGFSLFGCFPTNSNSTTSTVPAAAEMSTPPARDIPDESQIDAWLQVLEGGRVRILTGKMELGQGLKVVMQQVAGEELNIEPAQIEVIIADTGLTANEGTTAGSRSVERSAMQVRRAAAAAREQLKSMAAEQWEVETDQIEVAEAKLVRKDNQEELSFDELLAGQQLSGDIPDNVPLKPKDQYRWVGRPVPHPDVEKIVRGEAVYVQDMRFPDMVHARVIKPQVYGARIGNWTEEMADIPGVLKVVKNGSFVAVVAEDEYQAIKAMESLKEKIQWEVETPLPEVNSWSDFMLEKGDGPTEPGPNDARNHSAVYTKPYIMHGSIGPSCSVALYEEGQLHLWSHSQNVYALRATVSDLTGISEENIRVSGVRGSGCYGHNAADDVGGDAALVAMAVPDRHVRLQWQREEEHGWEPYGSAMRMALSATLSPQGKISRWEYHLWSDGHSTRPRGDASYLIAGRYLEKPFTFRMGARVGGGARNSAPYYNIPGARVEDHYVAGPLRVSALRSLGAYANIFAIECFMEELAEKAGQDPLTFRLNHSTDERSVAVIKKLQEMVSNETMEEGEGIGFGFSRYKNSAAYCAVAARVKVDSGNRRITPIKMWSVIEAGEAVNTDGLKNQTEGGMIQAASWTLKEEVQFNPERVTSRDWTSYPILRFDATPETVVEVIARPELPPLGAGEAAQGPAGAAVANAVYAASGKRVRELPVEKYL